MAGNGYTEQHLAELMEKIKETASSYPDTGWLKEFRDDPALPEALIRIFEDFDPISDDCSQLYEVLEGTFMLGKPAIRPLVIALESLQDCFKGEELVEYIFCAVASIDRYRCTYRYFVDEVIPIVIDELILRRSGRPEERFSSQIVAQVLEKAVEYKPRLYEKILHDLCDLAYEYEGGVRRRAVAVARRLGAGEFASLVKARAAENPTAASEIMRMLGGSEAAAFFSDLQRQALERFRAPLVELEEISRQRWSDLSRQARFSFYISMGLSVGLFFVGVVIVIWGLVLLTRSTELSRQIGGGILSTAMHKFVPNLSDLF